MTNTETPFERHALAHAIYCHIVHSLGIAPTPSYIPLLAECTAAWVMDDAELDAPIVVPSELTDKIAEFVRSQLMRVPEIAAQVQSRGCWPASLAGATAWSCAVILRACEQPRVLRERWARTVRAGMRLMAENDVPTWEAFYADESLVFLQASEMVDCDAFVTEVVQQVRDLQRNVIVLTQAGMTMMNDDWNAPLCEFRQGFTMQDARILVGEENLKIVAVPFDAMAAASRQIVIAHVAAVYGNAALAAFRDRLAHKEFLLP